MMFYGEGGEKDVDGGRALVVKSATEGSPSCKERAERYLKMLDKENATIMGFLGSSQMLEEG